jgi:hypothetical protein
VQEVVATQTCKHDSQIFTCKRINIDQHERRMQKHMYIFGQPLEGTSRELEPEYRTIDSRLHQPPTREPHSLKTTGTHNHETAQQKSPWKQVR